MLDNKLKSIVVLTGAGISAESGIPVFRGETGLWEGQRVEDVATYEGFMRDKEFVHEFYNSMRANIKNKNPNAAHLALKYLEDLCNEHQVDFTLVTQNIDDLHEKAGSKNILHMHGLLDSALCEKCGRHFAKFGDTHTDSICPYCKAKAMRPDIVWFGEMPYFMEQIEQKLMHCSLFLSIGTSGVVYPAAGFCALARQFKAKCIEFNLEKSAVASAFHQGIYDKASVSVPKFVEQLAKDYFVN